MKYYKYLYLADGLEKKREKIISKLENNKFQMSIHLVVLSTSKKNHFDIINSVLLLQPAYPKDDLFVVGIAKSYDDALELVEKIVGEVYDNTKDADIRGYVLGREQDD